MGRKNKLKRFADMKTFANVTEPELEDIKSGSFHLKGKWRSEVFKNDNPLILELGCGKGEYSVGLGRKYPNKNFIGIDIKGNRMWVGAKDALDNGLTNIHFLRTRIDFIEAFFEKGEIDEIWVTFPDPQPEDRRIKKRLTSPRFLERYKKFLKDEGVVHLKTDSPLLFEYTNELINYNGLEVLESTGDLYGERIQDYDKDLQEILSIKTYYETLFSAKGFKITYTKFKLKNAEIIDLPKKEQAVEV